MDSSEIVRGVRVIHYNLMQCYYSSSKKVVLSQKSKPSCGFKYKHERKEICTLKNDGLPFFCSSLRASYEFEHSHMVTTFQDTTHPIIISIPYSAYCIAGKFGEN